MKKSKRERSKLFIQSHNTTDSSVSIDTNGKVNPNCSCIISQDLLSDYNSQLSYCETQKKCYSLCLYILNQLLLDLDRNEDEMKCKSQQVNPFVALRSKVKRVVLSQRFRDGDNKIDEFQYERKNE